MKQVASPTYYQVQILLGNLKIKHALLKINFPQSSNLIDKQIQETLSSFGFNNLDINILNSLKHFIRTKDPNSAYLRNLARLKFVSDDKTGKEELWVKMVN